MDPQNIMNTVEDTIAEAEKIISQLRSSTPTPSATTAKSSRKASNPSEHRGRGLSEVAKARLETALLFTTPAKAAEIAKCSLPTAYAVRRRMKEQEAGAA